MSRGTLVGLCQEVDGHTRNVCVRYAKRVRKVWERSAKGMGNVCGAYAERMRNVCVWYERDAHIRVGSVCEPYAETYAERMRNVCERYGARMWVEHMIE